MTYRLNRRDNVWEGLDEDSSFECTSMRVSCFRKSTLRGLGKDTRSFEAYEGEPLLPKACDAESSKLMNDPKFESFMASWVADSQYRANRSTKSATIRRLVMFQAKR